MDTNFRDSNGHELYGKEYESALQELVLAEKPAYAWEKVEPLRGRAALTFYRRA
jgi:hypothetical protein